MNVVMHTFGEYSDTRLTRNRNRMVVYTIHDGVNNRYWVRGGSNTKASRLFEEDQLMYSRIHEIKETT